MSKTRIIGYGSFMEFYSVRIDKKNIKSEDDLYLEFIDVLKSWTEYRDTYFCVEEYKNDEWENIDVQENIISKNISILPNPDPDFITISPYNIFKKGYIEFDIDLEGKIDIPYSTFKGYQWSESIFQHGNEVDIEYPDSGRANEEGVDCRFFNSKGEIVCFDGPFFYLTFSDDDGEGEEISEIKEFIDSLYDALIQNP